MRYMRINEQLRISIEENTTNDYTIRTQKRTIITQGAYAYEEWNTMHTLRTNELNGESDKDVLYFAYSNNMFNTYA